MAKKQLKKLNQPKKYLQGGSNMGSVSMMRQNPYYLGQVNQDAAEEDFQNSQKQAALTQQNAVQAKADAKAQQEAELDQTFRNSATNMVKAVATDQKAGNLGKFMLPPVTTAAPATVMTMGNGMVNPTTGKALTMTLGKTTGGTQGVNFSNLVADGATVAGEGAGVAGRVGLMGSNMSAVGAGAIGVAANIGGQIIKKRTNDNSAYTATDKEMRGNLGGETLAAAGTGFSTGAMLGSFVPGIGNVVGGLVGAGIGAGIGAIKAHKENKAAREEAANLQRELAAQRGAFQSSFVNSRLTGVDTGFGLNSSTNMNNQFTNQYQVAKTGGVTGIQEDRRPKKVPGGKIVPIEGTDAVEFIGRSHAKGGVTIDKNTEVEGGETMDQVAMNNNGKQDYIFSKYLKLGGKSFAQRHKEILKGGGSQAEIQQLAAMQEKVAGRNPQQIAAYGGFHKYLEGGASATAAPTACPEGYIRSEWGGSCEPVGYEEKQKERWKTFGDKYGDDMFKDDTRAGRKFDRADAKIDKEFFGTKDRWKNISDQEGTEGETIFLTKEDSRKEKKGKLNLKFPETTKVEPTVDNQTVIANQNGVSNAPVDTTTKADNIDQEEQDWRNHWISQGYVFNAAGERELPPGKKLVVNDDGSEQIVDDTPASGTSGTAAYTAPTGITPNGNQQATTDWDTKKKSIIDQVNSTPDMLVEPDKKAQIIKMLNSPDPKMRDQAMYIFDLYSQVQVGQTIDPKVTPATGYNPAPGVTPTAATANTGTPTPSTATTADGFAPAAKRATSTGTAAGTPQTPEEKEAARLAGLPRLFMGASRTIDPTTGEATVYTDKPLMGVGAMAGSRLGTATGSQDDLAKVTNNSYDQAWQNKADNLYTNQKDASGGGLSSSDAIADRDKIAESNWGQKYGYKKGMTAEEAKTAHGKFAADVKSLFANNPDEMLGYFQYIIDGGDPTKADSYLGKDAEQIRANLTKKGFIGADGRPIAGKEKEMAAYLETQATNNAVGPIHNALGSYTAERSATKIKLKEGEKKKDEEVVQELPKKYEPCPPGTYRSEDGSCKPVGDVPQRNKVSGALMAGLGQLIPAGAALANPYKIAPGIMGAPAIKGALMPRVNMNDERQKAIQAEVAYKNAVINQNAGPGALAAMQMANTKTNEQMLKIAQQEQNQNRQLAAEEGKLGMQASMFNAETDQKRQMFNKEFNKDERRYRREDILGALDTAAARVAGIFKDDRSYKAQERLATALDETGSYDRFSILEQLNKDAKRKGSPYYGTTEAERRRIAAAMHKQLNPDGYVAMTEYNKLQEEKEKLEKEKEEAAKKNKAKFGGARQYVSRLGELQGVRATKAKL